jgi:hypothetical protein
MASLHDFVADLRLLKRFDHEPFELERVQLRERLEESALWSARGDLILAVTDPLRVDDEATVIASGSVAAPFHRNV